MDRFILDPQFAVGREYDRLLSTVIAHSIENVHWFGDDEALDKSKVGSKNANLASMFQHGMPIPEGFAVPSHVFTSAVDKSALLEACRNDDIDLAQKIAESTPVPREVFQMYDLRMHGQRVAVRSSAIAEDSSGASWAGRLNSYNYQSRDGGDNYFKPPDPRANDDNFDDHGLAKAIQMVWASFFGPVAMQYKKQQKALDDIRVAVVVQAQVDPVTSGVSLGANPVTGDLGEHMIEGGPGHGESTVGGEHPVDNFVLDHGTGRVKSIQGSHGVITPQDIKQIHQLTTQANDYFGYPQDTEWVSDGKGHIYLVQSRDITTGPADWPRKPSKQPGAESTLPSATEYQG